MVEHHRPPGNHNIEQSIAESLECVGTTFDWAVVTRFGTHGEVDSVEQHGEGWDRHEPADWEKEEQEGGDAIEGQG